MARKNGKKDIDSEVDYHGMTAEQMRMELDRRLPGWKGMSRVRVVHGQGTSLTPTLLAWCRERGIEWLTEPHNPGSTLLFPNRRQTTDETFINPIRAAMPEELQKMRLAPPTQAEQQRAIEQQKAFEEQRRRELARKELARRAQEKAAETERKRRQDEALWAAEKARLDAADKNHSAKKWEADRKPTAPAVVTRSVHTKHQEGYWRAELVRVADTETETLQKQKKTGLDKLAPPIEPKPPQKAEEKRAPKPTRDEAADRALFEAEMARLMEEG